MNRMARSAGVAGAPQLNYMTEDEMTVRWVHPDHRDWQVTYRLDDRTGELSIVGLTIEPAEDATPDRGLPAQLLRKLPTDGVLTWVRAELRRQHEHHPEIVRRTLADFGFLNVASEVSSGRPISLGYLAEIAAAYVDAWQAGSRTPTAAVADRLALEEGVIREPSTIARLVRRARKEGLLGPAPSGKAGGELTQRAFDLLEERAEDRERYRQLHSWIWMTHPSYPKPVRATEAAFRLVWKKRGWKKLGPADAPPDVVSPKRPLPQRGRA